MSGWPYPPCGGAPAGAGDRGGRGWAHDWSGVRHGAVARRYWDRAGVADKIELRIAPAVETLSALPGEPHLDFAFIDADKSSSTTYFEHALRLSRPGSMIIVDNVVRAGRVADAGSDDPAVIGTHRLAEAVAREERVSATVIQTVGTKGYDGFMLALVQ